MEITSASSVLGSFISASSLESSAAWSAGGIFNFRMRTASLIAESVLACSSAILEKCSTMSQEGREALILTDKAN
jgi:hypothetical protein